jgi:hypothetical protein
LEYTIRTNEISKGIMPIYRKRLNIFKRLLLEAEVTSFWMSRDSKTKTPISATEPARATDVIVVIVDDVIVDIIASSLTCNNN